MVRNEMQNDNYGDIAYKYVCASNSFIDHNTNYDH